MKITKLKKPTTLKCACCNTETKGRQLNHEDKIACPSRAHKEGFNAFVKGSGDNANPYSQTHSRKAIDWRNGYYEAKINNMLGQDAYEYIETE